MVTSEFPPGPGGIATHAWQLARHLASGGWTIEVLARRAYASRDERERFDAEQPFGIVSLPRSPFAARRALRRALDPRPDLLVASGRRAVWLAASLVSAPPRVAIGHGSEFTLGGIGPRWLTRLAFGRMNGVVCVSRHTEARMLDAGIRPAHRTVIPNGADPERFHPLPADRLLETHRRLGIPAGPVVLTVGHVSKRKGQDLVVRALPRLLQTEPRLVYAVAGLPTGATELERLAAELGVREHLVVLGTVAADDLNAVYNLCDLFVMPSREVDGDFEGYGIAVVEAALCAKPAVVSDSAGLVEAIAPGRTGLAVPEADPRSLAEALGELLADPARARAMGERARERALDEQTWRHRVASYDGWLRSIVERCAPSGGTG